MPWLLKSVFVARSLSTLQNLHLGAYFLHEVTFFFLLCYRPFGIQFHVETSLFTIYFAKLDREILKPVRWGVSDGQLNQAKSFGVKTFTDFTWKHMLDFYSCADCGRCRRLRQRATRRSRSGLRSRTCERRNGPVVESAALIPVLKISSDFGTNPASTRILA
ncbi:MAG: hypothetical protein WCC59_16950 [Terriglobales bacterium]